MWWVNTRAPDSARTRIVWSMHMCMCWGGREGERDRETERPRGRESERARDREDGHAHAHCAHFGQEPRSPGAVHLVAAMPRLQATTNGSLIALRALDGVVHSELALPCGAEYCHGGETGPVLDPHTGSLYVALQAPRLARAHTP